MSAIIDVDYLTAQVEKKLSAAFSAKIRNIEHTVKRLQNDNSVLKATI